MIARAALQRDWRLTGLQQGWRRNTGVLRADLLAVPLPAWVDPQDAHQLAALAALMLWTGGSVRLRMGYNGIYTPVLLTASKWHGDCAAIEAKGISGEIPRSRWWVIDESTLPPMPPLLRPS